MTAETDSTSQNRVIGGHGLAPSPVRHFTRPHKLNNDYDDMREYAESLESVLRAHMTQLDHLDLQSLEPGPLVAGLDADFGDMAKNYQPHEKYRQMRSLAIRLEHRLMELSNDQGDR
jgi:hypothetical protein